MLCLLVTGGLGATPAAARDWPETAGWTIFEGDDYCGMSLEFEGKGDTELLVGQGTDGKTTLVVANYGWSTRKGEEYDLTFLVNGVAFGGGSASGSEVGARKGFATKFEPGFWAALKVGSSLRIVKGDTLVDHLNLRGSAAAGAVVDRCVSHVRGLRAAEERERQRLSHIPDDPFAAKAEPRSPKPIGSQAAWVFAEDYPAAARAAGEHGKVALILTVTAAGRVSRCDVKSSSGSTALDTAACTLLTRRTRFEPATGADGKPVDGSYETAITWTLP